MEIKNTVKNIIIMGIVIGLTIVIVLYPDIRNSEAYARGHLAGLEEGFDQGFISGQFYQDGVYAAMMSNETPYRKNWYFWAGYNSNISNPQGDSIEDVAKQVLGMNLTKDINPYRPLK